MSSEYHSITGLNIRGHLFGMGKKSTIPPPPKPVKQTTQTSSMQTMAAVEEKIEMIDKKIAYLQTKVENERRLAQAALKAKDQDTAKGHLVTSRAHQKQIKLLNSHKTNLRQTVIASEQAHANKEFISTIQAVNADIKRNTMDVGEVDDMLADVAETQAQVNELSELTGRTIYEDPDTAVDEDDLAALLEEDEPVAAPPVRAKKAAPTIPGQKKKAPMLPTAPTHMVGEEDDDTAQLIALEKMTM